MLTSQKSFCVKDTWPLESGRVQAVNLDKTWEKRFYLYSTLLRGFLVNLHLFDFDSLPPCPPTSPILSFQIQESVFFPLGRGGPALV